MRKGKKENRERMEEHREGNGKRGGKEGRFILSLKKGDDVDAKL